MGGPTSATLTTDRAIGQTYKHIADIQLSQTAISIKMLKMHRKMHIMYTGLEYRYQYK